MSLVGPRPIIEEEVERYGDQVGYYLETRPGLTGLWQISGRNNIGYDDRVALDSWYVRNWSIWYDLVILVKTIAVVLRGKGAY
jgi:undecaprenyl-phosphate galactose phosphotransferase